MQDKLASIFLRTAQYWKNIAQFFGEPQYVGYGQGPRAKATT